MTRTTGCIRFIRNGVFEPFIKTLSALVSVQIIRYIIAFTLSVIAFILKSPFLHDAKRLAIPYTKNCRSAFSDWIQHPMAVISRFSKLENPNCFRLDFLETIGSNPEKICSVLLDRSNVFPVVVTSSCIGDMTQLYPPFPSTTTQFTYRYS